MNAHKKDTYAPKQGSTIKPGYKALKKGETELGQKMR